MKLDSNPTDGAALRDLAGEIRGAVDGLDDVIPPPDAAPAHARLVAGLEEYAGQLDSLADSGRGGAVQFQQQLAQTGVPGRAWVAAFNELAAKGYATWTPAEPHASFGEEPALGLEPRTSSLQVKRSAS